MIDIVCAHSIAPVIKAEFNGVAAEIRFKPGNDVAVSDERLKQPQQSALRFKPGAACAPVKTKSSSRQPAAAGCFTMQSGSALIPTARSTQ
jgi:hypothetical protein